MENPTKLQVLRYFNGTTEFGIFYLKGGDDEFVSYTRVG